MMRNIWEKETLHHQGPEDTINGSPGHRHKKDPLGSLWSDKAGAGTQPHSCHRLWWTRSSSQWNQKRWRGRTKQDSESRVKLPCGPATWPSSEAQWQTSGRWPWKGWQGGKETIHFQPRFLENPHVKEVVAHVSWRFNSNSVDGEEEAIRQRG